MWSNQPWPQTTAVLLPESQQRSLETDPPAVTLATDPLRRVSSSSSHVTGYQETAAQGGTLDSSELLHFHHYFTPLKSPQRTCFSSERIKS